MNLRIATVAVAMAVTTSAIAADKETVLNNVQMPVMINQGSSYAEATDSMFLYAGDRVMVLEGGSAQLNYANGCVQVLGGNEVAQVDSTGDTCNNMAAAGTHQALGSTGAKPGAGAGGLFTAANVTAGVVGLAAAVVIVDNANDNSSNNARPPASP